MAANRERRVQQKAELRSGQRRNEKYGKEFLEDSIDDFRMTKCAIS